MAEKSIELSSRRHRLANWRSIPGMNSVVRQTLRRQGGTEVNPRSTAKCRSRVPIILFLALPSVIAGKVLGFSGDCHSKCVRRCITGEFLSRMNVRELAQSQRKRLLNRERLETPENLAGQSPGCTCAGAFLTSGAVKMRPVAIEARGDAPLGSPPS